MFFGRFLVAALPFMGMAFASPVAKQGLAKRDSIVDIVDALESATAAPIAGLSGSNITATDAESYLTTIKDAIATAQASVGTASTKRSLVARQSTADDLNTVGTVLAKVITDLVTAVEGLAVDLESLPLVGALIIDIDGGLDTLLTGVEVVLEGVLEVLSGLLSGVSGLLESLGNGLLAVTEKHTTEIVRGKKFWVGLSDMQGWRISMEDSHSIHLYLPAGTPKLPSSSTTKIPEQPQGSTVTNNEEDEDGNAFAGVFDGHGGSAVAKFTGTTIHSRLASLDAYKSGEYEKALKQVFLKTDEDLRADPSFFNDPSGCTAVVGLITTDGRIIVANSGDSRSVLGYKGEAKAMSYDHKPTNKEETARITAAGGFVEFGRVNGNLALSRALGDFEFKQNYSLDAEHQIVTADPDIITHKVDGEEEFLVLACDGIWDCLSSQQVVDITRRAIAKGDSLGKICEDMMVKCLATDSETGGIGCDNMTVVIIALLGGRTPEEWQAWVKERVENKVGHDTPESVPDIFGLTQPSQNLGGITGAGFRAGGGGLANIASILGASGITFKQPDDSDDDDDDDDLHIIQDDELKPDGYMDGKALEEGTKPVDVTDKLAAEERKTLSSDSKKGSVELLDEDGDSQMDSDSDSTATGAPTNASTPPPQAQAMPIDASPKETSSPRPPSFSSIGSPTVPTPDVLRQFKSSSSSSGERMPDAVRVEGLMDTSENPVKM